MSSHQQDTHTFKFHVSTHLLYSLCMSTIPYHTWQAENFSGPNVADCKKANQSSCFSSHGPRKGNPK